MTTHQSISFLLSVFALSTSPPGPRAVPGSQRPLVGHDVRSVSRADLKHCKRRRLPRRPVAQKPPAKAEARRRRVIIFSPAQVGMALRAVRPSLNQFSLSTACRAKAKRRRVAPVCRPLTSDLWFQGRARTPLRAALPPFAGRGGRHQTKSPQRGRDIVAQGQATCGAAGRRHPG